MASRRRGFEWGAQRPLASLMYAHWVGWLLPTSVFGRSPVVVSGSLVGVLLMGRSTVTLFTARIFFVARLDRLVRRSRSMSFPVDPYCRDVRP